MEDGANGGWWLGKLLGDSLGKAWISRIDVGDVVGSTGGRAAQIGRGGAGVASLEKGVCGMMEL